MAWVKVHYGIWGDSGQDCADEFVEKILDFYRTNEREYPVWDMLIGEVGGCVHELEICDVPDVVGKVDVTESSKLAIIEQFLWLFVRTYKTYIGRSPNWDELVHNLAASALQQEVSGVPDALGQVGLAEAVDLEVACYICGKMDDIDEMVVTDLTKRIFVHKACLAPVRVIEVELELPLDTVMLLVNWSVRVNLPINVLVTKALREMIENEGTVRT